MGPSGQADGGRWGLVDRLTWGPMGPSGQATKRTTSVRFPASTLRPLPTSCGFVDTVLWLCGHRLVALPLTINDTLKWLSSLPFLKLEPF